MKKRKDFIPYNNRFPFPAKPEAVLMKLKISMGEALGMVGPGKNLSAEGKRKSLTRVIIPPFPISPRGKEFILATFSAN